tara:strand:- start:3374 stop:3655 length:282 start_codon:yes stop_codon:yes gene_type:complete
MTNYEAHSEMFHHQMEELKSWIADPELVTIPLFVIDDLWKHANDLIEELDRLEAMGTVIPSLTLTALRNKALIYSIPENLNLSQKEERTRYEH